MPTLVVVGASAGMGYQVASEARARGYDVFGVGRRQLNLIDGDPSLFVEYLSCDVAAAREVSRLESWAQGLPKLDAWVNNVGRSAWSPIRDADDKFIDEMLRTNLHSMLACCRVAAKVLTRDAAIVNMASLASRRGTANNSVYVATKFGVRGLTQSLAKELGPDGIRVNAVSPVLVETPGLMEALNSPSSPTLGRPPQGFLREFADTQTALGRLPTPLEVAQVVLWLAGSESSAVTGQNLTVDCGVFPS